MSHFNHVHKPILMSQAMKTPDAKATVVKEWDKLKNLPARQESKVESKQEVFKKEQKEGKTVQFATFMDFCHLKNSEEDKKFQKTKDVLHYVATL